tara:strand:+ start:16928 stop:17194 length:267 start_codon:yes stop_codon:yes gene_type:complete
MSLPTDPLRFQSLTAASTSTTSGANLTNCTIINNGAASISVYQIGDNYTTALTIASGQGIGFSSSDFEVLPTLKITTGAGTTLVSVIT